MWGSQLQFEGTSSKLGPISNLRAPAPIWCINSSLVALAQTCWAQLQCININPTPITETLIKNKQPLFSTRPPKTPKTKNEISSLKNDCNLFSRLYISCQTRDGNLERFFQHENQPTPLPFLWASMVLWGLEASQLCYPFWKTWQQNQHVHLLLMPSS